MRSLILVPDPAFPEHWEWAFDVEAAALRQSGVEVASRPWTEPGDLDRYDVILPLVAWGYQFETERWTALLDALETASCRTLNPVPVLRWNSDKAYLVELGAAGVPTIPTLRFDRFDEAALAAARAEFGNDIVIKPPVSAAAYGTFRLTGEDALPDEARGRAMLAQPFLSAIQSEGEYSLLLFNGEFSHALIKRPKTGDYRVQPHLGGREEPCDPPPGAVELAKAALAIAPAACAYARVDMLRDERGTLRIIELELIEPALWLDLASGAPAAFASAVLESLRK